MIVDSSIKKFCTAKQFFAGLAVGLALLAIIIPITIPLISANAENTQENSVAIAEINANLDNLDNTLEKLDNTIVKLDDQLDKLNLVLCDISKGDYC